VIGKPADEARAIGEFVAHHLAIGPSQLSLWSRAIASASGRAGRRTASLNVLWLP
jgi:hypothetical protein